MNQTETEKETRAEPRQTPRFTSVRFDDVDAEKAYAAASRLTSEIEKVIVGKHREVLLLITAMLAGGHVLIEDVPGVGKTTLAAALAKAAGLDFRRAQFTPDVTASDITGFNIYNRREENFEFTPGLVMTNILLADEINRASPKTQSALLEAMEEGRVTVDGKTYILPDPFMVIATQNPSGFVGTYPLPEAQLDRFSMKLSMGYPTPDEEMRIVEERTAADPLDAVSPVAGAKLISFLRALTTDVRIDRSLYKYLVLLVSATREHRSVSLGASPRASLALKRLSQAYAFMHGRNYVVPEDISDIFRAAIGHRIILKQEAQLGGVTCAAVLEDVLKSVPVPFKGER
ncbi:MAG: MoxR family ATPase [Eubacteriales bacterium]|nr:MoxR family ATPase [Clostridiales bacterium]MDD7301029.1 MoxR family ATPase [Eubacteriales bacterium]MDY4434524.1 MoxR family ATPase [Candidatus Flemingibacterium sp.]